MNSTGDPPINRNDPEGLAARPTTGTDETSPRAGSRWVACAASVQGTSHLRGNLPCQDSHEMRVVPLPTGEEVLVAAVSDGAGSAPRGADGARFVCTRLVEALASEIRGGASGTRLNLGEVIGSVRAQLLEHARSEGAAARQFACTLLCAVLTQGWAAFAQVGDGVIVTPSDPDWMWVFWPQRGEYANTTSFITDGNALGRLEVSGAERDITEIAMLTDGLQHLVLHYETAAVHSPFFEHMMAPLRASRTDGVDEALCRGLASYLASPLVAERTEDDLTVLLARYGESVS